VASFLGRKREQVSEEEKERQAVLRSRGCVQCGGVVGGEPCNCMVCGDSPLCRGCAWRYMEMGYDAEEEVWPGLCRACNEKGRLGRF
jgi:hypothetical protein